jgi:hypothetical protein
MTQRLGWAVLALVTAWALAGCPGGGPNPPTDGGDDTLLVPPIDVSGQVVFHPAAVDYLGDAGVALAPLEGLTVRVEDPLSVALGDPEGIFGSMQVPDAGTFAFTDVPANDVLLGLAAAVRDDGPDGGEVASPRVVRSATVVWDVAVEASKPKQDITDAVAFAVPMGFHDVLTQAVTVAKIQAIAGTQFDSLVEAGFILGRVVNVSGAPVAGARIAPVQTNFLSQFFYLSSDLSSATQATEVGASTSSNGLFVFVHTGGEVSPFNFRIEGQSAYGLRNAGAASGAALVMTVAPKP